MPDALVFPLLAGVLVAVALLGTLTDNLLNRLW